MLNVITENVRVQLSCSLVLAEEIVSSWWNIVTMVESNVDSWFFCFTNCFAKVHHRVVMHFNETRVILNKVICIFKNFQMFFLCNLYREIKDCCYSLLFELFTVWKGKIMYRSHLNIVNTWHTFFKMSSLHFTFIKIQTHLLSRNQNTFVIAAK